NSSFGCVLFIYNSNHLQSSQTLLKLNQVLGVLILVFSSIYIKIPKKNRFADLFFFACEKYYIFSDGCQITDFSIKICKL
ncbi:hypothetical protein, partial [Acinetobacter baumannii]|uniref:hypothetical protein n=1 Tax=Acinetobacter baumannii TaxID=470 RepID=UPI0021F7479B